MSHAKTKAADRLAEIIEGDDPEAFGTRATPTYGSRLVIRGKGHFQGWRVQLVLDDAVLNRGFTNRPTTFHVATGPRVIFSMSADPQGESGVIQGKLFPTHTLAFWRSDAEVHTQWPANLPWWNLVFPYRNVESAIHSYFGNRFSMPRESVRLAPINPQKREQFFSAMEGALRAPPSVNRGRLSDGLLTLVLDAIAPSVEHAEERATHTDRLTHGRRLAIADGLVALADRVDDPVSLLSVCDQLDVSLRTLNACSNAVLGMAAASYLRQRRLNRVFHDLHQGVAASVTEAAVKHGFWELGRFAASFRVAFGESPSRTLLRARGKKAG